MGMPWMDVETNSKTTKDEKKKDMSRRANENERAGKWRRNQGCETDGTNADRPSEMPRTRFPSVCGAERVTSLNETSRNTRNET